MEYFEIIQRETRNILKMFFNQRRILSLRHLGGVLVTVFLLAMNTNAVHSPPVEFNVKEELPPGTFVGNVKDTSDLASIYSKEILAQLTFAFRHPAIAPSRYFALDELTGAMRTSRKLDRELLCVPAAGMGSATLSSQCTLTVDVTVKPNQYFQIIRVNINVVDINDNAPIFPQTRLSLEIKENSAIGTSFFVPLAVDADSGLFGIQKYTLLSPTDAFQLVVRSQYDGSKDIRLNLTSRLDREQVDRYSMTIVAADGGTPPRSGSIAVDIIVTDANDNIPKFDELSYEVEVSEAISPGSAIARVHATDPDQGDNGLVRYTFAEYTDSSYGKLFGINNLTGEIVLKSVGLDYERQMSFQLTVVAHDLGPGSLPAFAKVAINVIDENDNAPEISLNSLTASGRVEINENAEPGMFVAYLTVKDGDSGKNGQVDCFVDGGLFQLDSVYGTEFKLTSLVSFDREAEAQHVVPLTCSDKGKPPKVETIQIFVNVLDENDHYPVISSRDPIIVELKEGNSIGTVIAAINATDADDGKNAALVYSIESLAGTLDDVVSIDMKSGLLYAEDIFDFEKRNEYKFLVTVSDQADGSPLAVSSGLTLRILDVNDEVPKFERAAYRFTTTENLPIGSSVGRIRATDADVTPEFAKVVYGLQEDGKVHTGAFDLNKNTGILTTLRRIDREAVTRYDLVVSAYNDGYPPKNFVDVTIDVDDENDNTPVLRFPNEFDNVIQISRSVDTGSFVTRIDATDADAGKNSQLVYAIANGNEEGTFAVNPKTGAITTTGQIQTPGGDSYRLVVTVSDRGVPEPLQATADLIIRVNSSIDTLGPVHLADRAKTSGDVSKHVSAEVEKFMIIAGIVGAIVLLAILLVVLAFCLINHRRRRTKRREYMRQNYGGGQSPNRGGADFVSLRSCNSWRDGGASLSVGAGRCGGGSHYGPSSQGSLESRQCCGSPHFVRAVPDIKSMNVDVTLSPGPRCEREETDEDDDVIPPTVPLRCESRKINELHTVGSFRQYLKYLI